MLLSKIYCYPLEPRAVAKFYVEEGGGQKLTKAFETHILTHNLL